VFVGHLGWGLNGIALGSAVTYFVYWMAHTTLVRRYYHQRIVEAVARNLVSGWPGFMIAALVVLAWRLGYLDISRPLVEMLYLAPVLVVTVVRVSWARLPRLAHTGR